MPRSISTTSSTSSAAISSSRRKGWASTIRRRRIVEAQPFLRLLEIAADDVDKVVEIDLGIRIEGIDIVERDQPRAHVPFVVPRALVFGDDIRLRLVVGAEELDVHLRIFVADRRIGEK